MQGTGTDYLHKKSPGSYGINRTIPEQPPFRQNVIMLPLFLIRAPRPGISP